MEDVNLEKACSEYSVQFNLSILNVLVWFVSWLKGRRSLYLGLKTCLVRRFMQPIVIVTLAYRLKSA